MKRLGKSWFLSLFYVEKSTNMMYNNRVDIDRFRRVLYMVNQVDNILCQLEHREVPKLFYSEKDVDVFGHMLKPLICRSIFDVSAMFGLQCNYKIDDFQMANVEMTIKAQPDDVSIHMFCIGYPKPQECPMCLYQFFLWNDLNWFKHVYTYEFCKNNTFSVKKLRSMGAPVGNNKDDAQLEVYHIGGWTAVGEHESFGLQPFLGVEELAKMVGTIYMEQMCQYGLVEK